METTYEITVEIGGYVKSQEREIRKACMVEWGFRDDDFEYVPATCGRKRLLQASALSSVYDGEDVEDTVSRIEHAVWRANGGMCHVQCHVLKMREVGGCRVLTPCEEADSLVA